MNERILELAEQTERLAEDELAHLERVHNRLYSFTEGREIYNQKFAELIVKECAGVLKKDMELAHIQLIPLDFKMYANGRLQRTIKEHFGVKE